MKKLFLPAFGLLMLGACAQDEMMEVNRNGDEITFSVVTNSATRAADVFCNNNMPDAFYVSAKTAPESGSSKIYFNEDKVVTPDGGTTWTDEGGVRYWPEEKLDFYAHVNGDDTYSFSTTGATFTDFTVNGNVANQVDLLYAVKTGQTKTSTPVTLNFRHALSQIVFKAKNKNAKLYVEIAGVKVANVKNKGDFTFPTASTNGNIEHPESGTSASSTPIGTQGNWTLEDGVATYEADFTNVKLVGNGEVQNLTDFTGEHKDNSTFGNVMLLMPQTTTAWEPNATYPSPTTEGQTGSYLLVDCVIYNVSGESFDATNDLCLWGEAQEGGTYTTKELAIPASFTWEQGKKYIYTLVFGDGNGGYDPDPEPGPDPDPVLVPITYEVSVDEFVNGGEIDIESGVPTTQD